MEESEASILSMLQPSTESTGIHRLFTEHLHPFTPFTAAKKQCKPLLPAIRPLAKRFASFICNSISLIPKRLSESPKISQNSALELLESYRLCLDCFEVIAPELTGVPHKVQVQRIRYIHSLEHWDLFKEAEDEGFVVLESLNAISKEGLISKGGLKGKPRKQKGRLVPQLKEGDRKLAFSVLEVVVTLVKCAMKRRSKMEADYWRVISLVNESEPCFKILDAKDYEKLHHFLETNLHIIAAFLVSEMKSFSVDLILEFSAVALKEYEKSSSHTQMYNVAVKICSTCFYQRNKLSSDTILEVLIHVLDFLASVCKDGADTNFLDLVCYCADKCQHATFILCDPFGKYLYTTSDFFHEKDMFLISSILRLYASGLLAHSSNQLKGEDSEKGRHSLQVYSKERLQQVALSVNWLNEYYNIAGKEKSSCEGISQLPYWKALKFFCLSLAESIYSRKEIFLEAENGSCWEDLSGIHDAFHQFCRVFLNCLSATEKRKETSGDNHRVISVVVVAALMLSFKTNQFIKESAQLVTQIISAEWVPIKRLKFIHVALQNISLILNKDRYQKQAINSLEMCLENFNGTESSGSRVPHPPETIQQEGGSRMSSIPPVSRPPETEGGSRMSSIPPVSRPPETEGGSIMSMNLPLSRPSETASASAPQMTRRRVIRWTREEEQTLENGYELICGPPGGLIPWTDILKFGEGKFHPNRTAGDLKDKWRNMTKAKARLNPNETH